MPRSKTLALTVLLVLGSTAVPALACSSVQVTTFHGEDGKQLGIALTEEQFSRIPAWTPQKGEPPLSLRKVITLAERWARENWSEFGRFEAASAEYRAIGCTPEKRKWIYSVTFRPIEPSPRAGPAQFLVVVLPDGTVLPLESSGGDV